MKNVWLIASVIFGAVCAVPWTGDPRVALADWSPPSGTISYVELASRFAPWKRGTLGMSCDFDHTLRLVLRSRLPGPPWTRKLGDTDRATIFIQGQGHSYKVEVPVTLSGTGMVDTLTSESLSRPMLHSLITSFGTSEPKKVDVMTMETGSYMNGIADGAAVQRIVSTCFSRP